MSGLVYYILDGHEVIACDVLTWAAWFEGADQKRQVAHTKLEGCEVSTVFVGIDPFPWGDHGRPLVFETMVFGGPTDRAMERYSSWDEAVIGHEMMVAAARTVSEGRTNRKREKKG